MQEKIDLEDASFFKFLSVINNYKLTISLTILITSLVAIIYTTYAEKLYQAQVVMISNFDESSNDSSIAGLSQALGGLAGLSGVGISAAEKQSTIALATLDSKKFINSYLEDSGLKKLLFPDDLEDGEWKEGKEPTIEQIGSLKQKRFFVSKNKMTGLITLTVQHPDPNIAFNWANGVVVKINEQIRKEDIAEGEKNIAFLQKKLQETNLKNIRSVFFSLLENQTQKMMLANIREDHAFKVIDPAILPQSHIKPRKSQGLIIGFILGLMLGILIALILNFIKEQEELS